MLFLCGWMSTGEWLDGNNPKLIRKLGHSIEGWGGLLNEMARAAFAKEFGIYFGSYVSTPKIRTV